MARSFGSTQELDDQRVVEACIHMYSLIDDNQMVNFLRELAEVALISPPGHCFTFLIGETSHVERYPGNRPYVSLRIDDTSSTLTIASTVEVYIARDYRRHRLPKMVGWDEPGEIAGRIEPGWSKSLQLEDVEALQLKLSNALDDLVVTYSLQECIRQKLHLVSMASGDSHPISEIVLRNPAVSRELSPEAHERLANHNPLGAKVNPVDEMQGTITKRRQPTGSVFSAVTNHRNYPMILLARPCGEVGPATWTGQGFVEQDLGPFERYPETLLTAVEASNFWPSAAGVIELIEFERLLGASQPRENFQANQVWDQIKKEENDEKE